MSQSPDNEQSQPRPIPTSAQPQWVQYEVGKHSGDDSPAEELYGGSGTGQAPGQPPAIGMPDASSGRVGRHEATPLSWVSGTGTPDLAPDDPTRPMRPGRGIPGGLPSAPSFAPAAGNAGLAPPVSNQQPAAPSQQQLRQATPRPNSSGGGVGPPSRGFVAAAQPSQSFLASAAGAVKIGLWGGPESGKTTYLAALQQAVDPDAAAVTTHGNWDMIANNMVSKQLMVDWAHTLVIDREFPAPTQGIRDALQWLFMGDLAGTRFDHRLLKRGPLEGKFVLDLIDVSGEAFDDKPKNSDLAERALDHLSAADGLIFLFDPIRESDRKDTANYVNNAIQELRTRHLRSGGDPQRYLRQHLSVCVTKFDHPRVFQRARELGFANSGNDGIPRIPDEDAEAFFDALCSGDFWGVLDEESQASAEFVRRQLRRAFDPKHTRYYATSSIGFRKPPGWSPATSAHFNPQDFQNFSQVNGQMRIRGAIRPINVLEPLITLAQETRRQGRP